MKIRFGIFLITACMLLFASVAVAQEDDDPSPLDVLTENANNEVPEFSTLLAVVQSVDPSVVALLDSNPQITIFAPTDAAFTTYAETIGDDAYNELLTEPGRLTSILFYHIVPGTYTSIEIIAELRDTDTLRLTTIFGQQVDITQDEDGTLFVDGTTIVPELSDIEAGNSIIHGIDAVLLPEEQPVAGVITELAADEDAPEFTYLAQAVAAADPIVIELLSDTNASITVFAPSDAAFEALIEEIGQEAFDALLADPEQATLVLLNHIVPSALYTEEIELLLSFQEDNLSNYATLLPESMLTINLVDVEDSDEDEQVLTINETVTISEADIDVVGGVIHVIDSVLLPPEDATLDEDVLQNIRDVISGESAEG